MQVVLNVFSGPMFAIAASNSLLHKICSTFWVHSPNSSELKSVSLKVQLATAVVRFEVVKFRLGQKVDSMRLIVLKLKRALLSM